MTKTTSQDNEKGTIGGEKVPILLSKRWILAYIGMVGFFFIYSLRVNLSVAIVCMVKDDVNKTTSTNLSTSNEATCTADTPSNSTNNGEFDWDKDTQSLMLSAFFYGYIVLQVPGGWMAGRFGGKRVLGIGVLVTAIATVLLPVAARQDHRAVYALRVIMGLAEGVSFPCMHSMWGRWSPTMERTRLASFTYAGLNVGNVVTYIVSGLLCAYGFDNGWAAIFYLTGGAAFIWVFAWFVFVYDSPEDHPSISQAERDYIVSHRGDKQTKKFKVPWKSVVKSRAMWMCLGAHLCNNWMHYTLLTGLPTFMKQVLKYDIKQNGVLSAVPYMAMIFTQIFAGHAADFLRRRFLSTTHTRRLFQSVSFLGSGACIVAVGFIDCERRTIAVVLLTLAVALEGLCYAGYMVNQVDFAPRYAGVLFGITNFISTIPGTLAPIVTGKLTPNNYQSEWRTVFYLCGAFTLIGTIIFGGFASGEIQPWAVGDEEDDLNMEMTVKPDSADAKMDNGGHNNLAFSKLDEKKEKSTD